MTKSEKKLQRNKFRARMELARTAREKELSRKRGCFWRQVVTFWRLKK